jgi:hypothetical protein
MPLWVPNPFDSIILFVSEALIVLVFALTAVLLAAIALWVF